MLFRSAVGDEQDRITTFARLTNVGYPVAGPTAEFERRLAGDVMDLERRALARSRLDRQLLQTPRRLQTAVDLVPGDEGALRGRGRDR